MPLTARRHCGRTVLEIAGKLPAALTRCTCSFCSNRGHLYAYFPPQQLIVKQADSDAVYRWNTWLIANHFLQRLRLRPLR